MCGFSPARISPGTGPTASFMAPVSLRARPSSPADRSRNAIASSSLAMSAMRVYPPGMRRIIAAALVGAALLLAACGGSGPSQADCKKALKAQYAAALATGKKSEGEPAECKGLSNAVITRLVGQVIAGQ